VVCAACPCPRFIRSDNTRAQSSRHDSRWWNTEESISLIVNETPVSLEVGTALDTGKPAPGWFGSGPTGLATVAQGKSSPCITSAADHRTDSRPGPGRTSAHGEMAAANLRCGRNEYGGLDAAADARRTTVDRAQWVRGGIPRRCAITAALTRPDHVLPRCCRGIQSEAAPGRSGAVHQRRSLGR
jgi:hypothetical protein